MLTAPVELSEPELASSPSAPSSARKEQVARGALLAVLFAALAFMAMRHSPGGDPDIWWHLRAGQWILQHHAFPHTDPFSRFGATQHWEAYSWLFELTVFSLFRSFGLAGVLAFSVGMVLAITAALYRLIARFQTDFSKIVLLTFAAMASFSRLYEPRPWLFTILFFTVQLELLLQARRSGEWKRLLWLLPLYALWANLHIQFIDGLVVLAAAAIEPLLMRWWPWPRPVRLPARKLFVVLGLCLAATLLNPYGWKIYAVAYALATQPGVINQITELLAMPFRSWNDYLILGFAIAPGATLAWKRRFPLWETLLLAAGIFLSFRSQRDIWFLATVAAMVLAAELPAREEQRRTLPRAAAPLIAAVVLGAIFLGAPWMHIDAAHLQKDVADDFPLHAVEAVRAKGYPGPLYNTYNWGGFLIWNLRLPVSIDGRAALYGTKLLDRSQDSWDGNPDWAADPQLLSARLVIAPVKSPLTQLLRGDLHFRKVYEDKVAAVFVRQ
jgi:hypothetical protein